jgi:hypothetical protein
MTEVLKEMGFGEDMLRMVGTLYNDVQAKVEVNGELTEEVVTGGGVRQLSPYIFICVAWS